MPIMDLEERRAYNREWARRKRAGLETSGIRPIIKLSVDEREANKKKYKRINIERKRKKAVELVGDKCLICGTNIHLIFHRKDGTPHPNKSGNYSQNKTLGDVLKEPQEFARVCMKCHIAVHWIMKWFKWDWDKIIENLIYNE